MVISTLEYIHKLLKSNCELCEREYKDAASALRYADEDQPEYLVVKNRRDKAYRLFDESQDALRDFETHEW